MKNKKITNTIPKEFHKYIDEDLIKIAWENEGEKVSIYIKII